MRALPLAASILLLAGCLHVGERGDAGVGNGHAALWAFDAPVQVNGQGHGFEPSLAVLHDGRLVITAHKATRTSEGSQVASWLWSSGDNGTTWSDVTSPGGVNRLYTGQEGDLAVDGKDRLYFADTFGTDTWLSRWTEKDGQLAWDSTQPHVTLQPADDRPWLAAQGDGILYYAANAGAPIPAPNTLTTGQVARFLLYTSTDGGASWSNPFGFPTANANSWCTIAASPADDMTVMAACDEGNDVLAYVSHDRGATFHASKVATVQRGFGTNFPVVAAVGWDGLLHAGWIDTAYDGATPASAGIATSADGLAWSVQSVPLPGDAGMPWLAAGRAGTLALFHYGSDTPAGKQLYLQTLATVDGGATWTDVRMDPKPVSTDGGYPGDFFQGEIGPDNRLEAAYQRGVKTDAGIEPGAADIWFARQASGPNG